MKVGQCMKTFCGAYKNMGTSIGIHEGGTTRGAYMKVGQCMKTFCGAYKNMGTSIGIHEGWTIRGAYMKVGQCMKTFCGAYKNMGMSIGIHEGGTIRGAYMKVGQFMKTFCGAYKNMGTSIGIHEGGTIRGAYMKVGQCMKTFCGAYKNMGTSIGIHEGGTVHGANMRVEPSTMLPQRWDHTVYGACMRVRVIPMWDLQGGGTLLHEGGTACGTCRCDDLCGLHGGVTVCSPMSATPKFLLICTRPQGWGIRPYILIYSRTLSHRTGTKFEIMGVRNNQVCIKLQAAINNRAIHLFLYQDFNHTEKDR